jgi:hypothetical protein
VADGALKQLERLRREALERAQSALADAQRERAAAASARRALLAEGLHEDRELAVARAAFAGAGSVAELRRAASWARASSVALEARRVRVSRVEERWLAADQKVREAERVLRAAAVGERTLERVVERRRREVSRSTEQRAEDERDDAFRARWTR